VGGGTAVGAGHQIIIRRGHGSVRFLLGKTGISAADLRRDRLDLRAMMEVGGDLPSDPILLLLSQRPARAPDQ
jgi:hypothetical protein